jgi:ParB-like chromosome segregation protein Spo0J
MKNTLHLHRIEVAHLLLTLKNPRRDAADDPDLPALAASIGPEEAPTLAQPPLVEDLGDGQYRVLGGERRIRAAKLAAWHTIECLVRPRLDPMQAHRLRVVENLHRKDLHPLDQAIALKIAWYSANAEALGCQAQAAALLDQEQPLTETLTGLEGLLAEAGFIPSHPAVSWDETLDGLGIALEKERRKKLMQVLGVAPELQGQIRTLDMTEASLRALAKLEPEDQKRLVEEIAENPELAHKVRRISHAVRTQDYALEDALAEAQGQGGGLPAPVSMAQAARVSEETPTLAEGEPEAPAPIDYVPDAEIGDLVVQLMDATHALKTTLEQLHTLVGDTPLATLAAPWGLYAEETLTTLRTALELFD